MLLSETLQLTATIISAVALVITSISASLAYWSLRSTHDWNRRKAAQDATLLYNTRVTGRELLERETGYLSSQEPIPLAQIQAKFDNAPGLKSSVHSLLNYFEMLARGVNQNIYDEEVVRKAWKGAMMRAVKRFGPYIDDRRSYSARGWVELESLTAKWKNEDSKIERRASTG